MAGRRRPADRLRVEGNSIVTMRATARLRLPNGALSDLKRTVAAQIKYLQPQCERPVQRAALVRHGLEQLTAHASPAPHRQGLQGIRLRKLLAFGSGVGIEIGADTPGSDRRARPPVEDRSARPAADRELCRPPRRGVGRRVCALPEVARHGPPQRHRAAAAPRSDRAPDGAPRRRRQGHRKRHPLPDRTRCTRTARRTWSGARRGWRSARCWSGSCAAQVVDRYRAAVQRGRHSGQQLHFLGRRRACRHPAQRRRARRRASSPSAAPPRAASRSTAKARRARSSPPSSTSRRSAPPCWRSPSFGCRPTRRRSRSNRFCPSPPSIRWKTISPATHYRTRRRWPGPVPAWRRRRTCCRRNIAAPVPARS